LRHVAIERGLEGEGACAAHRRVHLHRPHVFQARDRARGAQRIALGARIAGVMGNKLSDVGFAGPKNT